MFPFFKSAPASTSQRPANTKRAARNAKLRALYADPLPIPAAAAPFNVFSPSTYASLFSASPRPHSGTWNAKTRSVEITDDAEGMEIWRRGMWGKGTLSRSQPSWRERKTKEMTGGKEISLEELTALKRKERAEFKEERLKHERMERERQLRVEAGISFGEQGQETIVPNEPGVGEEQKPKRKRQKLALQKTQQMPIYSPEYLDKEVLQISPDEALFLLQLGLLVIHYNNAPLSISGFLHLIATSAPDDPFLVHYVVYYHYRRQSIIVKTGLKFGVDYLLYYQPIPISHAPHCVNILAVYPPSHPTEEKLVREVLSWQEINLWQRLMGNVRKKLKLVYVLIPTAEGGDWRDVEGKVGLEKVLGRYKLREMENRRMVMARERDIKPGK